MAERKPKPVALKTLEGNPGKKKEPMPGSSDGSDGYAHGSGQSSSFCRKFLPYHGHCNDLLDLYLHLVVHTYSIKENICNGSELAE